MQNLLLLLVKLFEKYSDSSLGSLNWPINLDNRMVIAFNLDEASRSVKKR